MNKRLLLALYDRSGLGAYMPVDYKGQELEVEEHWEKFAELIVRDCMDVVDGYTKPRTFDTHYDAVEQIEALFGIKHNGVEE
jgi:hypothetical protein